MLLLLLLFALPVWAQDDRGDLTITAVRETDNKPVAGATVLVKKPDSKTVLAEGVTDSEGRLRLPNLPIGDYYVEVSHPDAGKDGLIMAILSNSDNNFEAFLTPDTEEQLVEIKDDRLLVNTKDPSAGATTRRSRQFLDRQLTDRGSLQSLMATVPGVQSNSLGQVHVRGEHKALTLSLDGIALPIATESSITQPIDPDFIDTAEISTGSYDAAQGGQLGAVVNARTQGEGDDPFVSLEGKVGDFGQTQVIVKAGGETEDKLSYFVGAKHITSDMYLEPADPDAQTANNNGRLASVLVRLKKDTGKDQVGLTVSHTSADLGVPQTAANDAAGVEQRQVDQNTLALISWNHQQNEDEDLLFGLAFQRNRQKVNNNGVFTPFATVPEALEEELAEEGFPLDPTNPGSPYLPAADLTITQIKPSFDWTRRFGENHRIRAGLTANFISSDQELFITDPGGGGGLPNPSGLPGSPIRFAANVERDAFVGGIYASHTVPLGDQVVLNYGVRAETFDDGVGNTTGQISPRVNFTWAPTETQAVRLSYNRLFQPPPIELDVSGQTQVVPQRTDAYELSYENQFARNMVARVALVRKEYKDQLDVGLLIPNSNIPIFAPVNFARARYQGIELGFNTTNKIGWNGFLTGTIGEAKPTRPGLFVDHFPEFNDHDQRVQVTGGTSYTWEGGLSAGVDFLYGSGYPQEALPLYNSIGIRPYGLTGDRVDRFITNVNIQYFPTGEGGKDGSVGAGLQVFNVFDDRSLLNLFSEFSGTRFVPGRRFLLNLQGKF